MCGWQQALRPGQLGRHAQLWRCAEGPARTGEIGQGPGKQPPLLTAPPCSVERERHAVARHRGRGSGRRTCAQEAQETGLRLGVEVHHFGVKRHAIVRGQTLMLDRRSQVEQVHGHVAEPQEPRDEAPAEGHQQKRLHGLGQQMVFERSRVVHGLVDIVHIDGARERRRARRRLLARRLVPGKFGVLLRALETALQPPRGCPTRQ